MLLLIHITQDYIKDKASSIIACLTYTTAMVGRCSVCYSTMLSSDDDLAHMLMSADVNGLSPMWPWRLSKTGKQNESLNIPDKCLPLRIDDGSNARESRCALHDQLLCQLCLYCQYANANEIN